MRSLPNAPRCQHGTWVHHFWTRSTLSTRYQQKASEANAVVALHKNWMAAWWGWSNCHMSSTPLRHPSAKPGWFLGTQSFQYKAEWHLSVALKPASHHTLARSNSRERTPAWRPRTCESLVWIYHPCCKSLLPLQSRKEALPLLGDETFLCPFALKDNDTRGLLRLTLLLLRPGLPTQRPWR